MLKGHHLSLINRVKSGSSSPEKSPEHRLSPKNYRRNLFRRVSDFSDIQHLTEMPSGIQLTDRQKLLIRKAWANVNKRAEPGKWVVRRLFTRYPEIRKVFGIDDSALKHLDSHPIFIRHSQVFQNLLEMIVDSLDALDDQLGPLLVSYGCRHVSFERQFGFQPEMWQKFADVMCELADNWRLSANSGETLMAWRYLVLFVVDKVHRGFEEEKLHPRELK